MPKHAPRARDRFLYARRPHLSWKGVCVCARPMWIEPPEHDAPKFGSSLRRRNGSGSVWRLPSILLFTFLYHALWHHPSRRQHEQIDHENRKWTRATARPVVPSADRAALVSVFYPWFYRIIHHTNFRVSPLCVKNEWERHQELCKMLLAHVRHDKNHQLIQPMRTCSSHTPQPSTANVIWLAAPRNSTPSIDAAK